MYYCPLYSSGYNYIWGFLLFVEAWKRRRRGGVGRADQICLGRHPSPLRPFALSDGPRVSTLSPARLKSYEAQVDVTLTHPFGPGPSCVSHLGTNSLAELRLGS